MTDLKTSFDNAPLESGDLSLTHEVFTIIECIGMPGGSEYKEVMSVNLSTSDMRKVILALAVSLDGYIEGPNGEYDWCFMDQDYGMSTFMNSIDAVFVGRKTYEMSLGMEADMSGMPKMDEYVFSNTLDKVKEGSVLIKGDIKTQVEKIKNKTGKDIWLFGGASLTTTLMNLKLIDEVHLAVHPILLGGGKSLVRDISERVNLKLIDTKTYSSGLVSLKYSVVRS